LGTSGARNLSNMYGNTMAQQDSNLMDNFRNQTLQNLNTSAQMYAMPYDMMRGTTGLSQSLANSVANYNMQSTDLANRVNAANWGALSGNIGSYNGSNSSNSSNSDKEAQMAMMMAML